MPSHLPRPTAAIAALVVASLVTPAWAHAILMSSQPAVDASVVAGQVPLTLTYNSRIDRERSVLILVRPDRSRAPLAIAPSGASNVLTSQAELAPGSYIVRWQVLATDGHITRGDVPFTVTTPAAGTAPEAPAAR